jgi:murein tripeptide amidase MpaA
MFASVSTMVALLLRERAAATAAAADGEQAACLRANPPPGLTVTLPPDGGSIEVEPPNEAPAHAPAVDAGHATVRVRLHADPVCVSEGGALFRQWFYFRVAGLRAYKPGSVRVRVVGCGTLGMCGAGAYEGYQVCASYDLRTWFRVGATRFDGADLLVDLPKGSSAASPADRRLAQVTDGATRQVAAHPDALHLAYFEPFSQERHAALLAQVTSGAAAATLEPLITTPGGRTLDLLRFAAPALPASPRPLQVWLLARQHPSETAAAWWMEGLLGRLADRGGSDLSRDALLARCEVHVVPNMNPDGACLGHTRANLHGVNLNRMWARPTAAESPEVLAVRDRMDRVGCDLLLDVHQDETLSGGAIACCAPAWTPRLLRLQRAFSAALAAAAGDLFDAAESEQFLLLGASLEGSTEDNSEGGRLDQMSSEGANLTLATTQAGARFDCLAVTIEQPFKPVQVGGGDGGGGWDADCSRRLGHATIDAVVDVLGMLHEGRAE